jgi:signal transduction histidine kinase
VERARRIVAPGVEVAAQCPGSGVTVTADEFRMAQVVRNLLTNAVRHTPSGRIDVSVEDVGGRLRLTVRDTGEGIPADEVPLIWQRFYRTDTSRATTTGGSGLGLAITRRIVEDHGGEVFASSSPGQGSAIGFEVPADGRGLAPRSAL